jgi:hypothetical protein
MNYDLSTIHGSTVLREGVALLEKQTLAIGDTILFPCGYRIRYSDQPRADFELALKEIQAYTVYWQLFIRSCASRG